MFKRILLGITIVVFSITSAVADIKKEDLRQFDNLSDSDKAEIIRLIDQKNKTQSSAPTVEKVDQWVNLSANIGKGLAAAAKEVGVVANEFVQTPVGKLTAALIIWKIVGNQLIHVGGALLLFFTLVPLWFYMYRRYCVIDSIEYVPHPNDPKKTLKKVNYKGSKLNDYIGERVFGMVAILGAIIAVTVIIGVTGG